MAEIQGVLVTGPTGKVGQTFIRRFLSEPKSDEFVVRTLCHNRLLEPYAASKLSAVRWIS
jgi:UDP-glucose 4-epimerase